nr:MAG TPA: hypothetical protein [Crassvirales sp.]
MNTSLIGLVILVISFVFRIALMLHYIFVLLLQIIIINDYGRY